MSQWSLLVSGINILHMMNLNFEEGFTHRVKQSNRTLNLSGQMQTLLTPPPNQT